MKVWRIALSLLIAGAAWAQPPQGGGPRVRLAPGRGPLDFETRLTQGLGLDATQQNALHTALEEERTQTKGTVEQRQALRQSLAAAVKAGNPDPIDSITQQIATLDQQRNAIHAKTIMKFYASLTADQKTKAGPNLEMLMGPAMRAPMPRPARRPAPPNQN